MYDIYFDLANMHQPVDDSEIVVCAGSPIYIGTDYAEGEDASVQQEFCFDFDLDICDEGSTKSEGCTCTKCEEFFPYAEPNQADGSFKCWSCRSY